MNPVSISREEYDLFVNNVVKLILRKFRQKRILNTGKEDEGSSNLNLFSMEMFENIAYVINPRLGYRRGLGWGIYFHSGLFSGQCRLAAACLWSATRINWLF